jgi:MFS-type transporter involved in bile tolerance (Atg22 family)
MSLKAFHIVFVAMSILLCFFCGAWLLYEFASERDAAILVAAILAFAGGGGLICYSRSVLRKLKHISYL